MKLAKLSVVLLSMGLFLVGCGQDEAVKEGEAIKEVNLDDIKSNTKKQTKIVDGKEVEEYIMDDGAVIQMDPNLDNEDEASE